ncbi:MAG: zinc-dependent metalloprotease [Actinomycetota bacterium]
MAAPVDWDLAERVAVKIATRGEVVDEYALARMAEDFEEMTPQAEKLVGEETGLWSLQGEARSRLVSRPDWIRANINSFQRLLAPVVDKLDDMSDGPFGRATRAFAGAEVGVVLGWMATRVLGQYDLLLTEDENPEDQDIVYYVGPNVLALERRNGFNAEQFRLWLALHETTHRAQFTGVPWLRDHFVSLVNDTLDNVDPDPGRLFEVAKEVLEARRNGTDPLADGGLPALIAGPEQRAVLDKIGGMMSLLEGHGDVTMDRAGIGIVHDAEHFAGTLRARRDSARGLSRIIQRVVGLEAKLNQYAAGEAFIARIEDQAGGPRVIDHAWQNADSLPTMDEIRDPDAWLSRVVEPAA